jgi:hypothetical protein
VKSFILLSGGEKIQVNLREPERIVAEVAGHVITLILKYLCKYLMLSNLEARGVEPLFPPAMSGDVHGCFTRAISEANAFSWTSMDVRGCY